MADNKWQCCTPTINSTAASIDAASLDADSTIGMVITRISVSITGTVVAASDTGKALIIIYKHDGATAGGNTLTPIATDGGTDALSVVGKDYSTASALTGMANRVVVASKYWPVTSQAQCVFDFNALIGRPLKINGGDGVLVDFDGTGTNADYVVNFEGEE
jgi:hypothetical protein